MTEASPGSYGAGTLQQSYAYDVFGAVTSQSGSLGSEQQFAGQETDPTGLQYLRARFYDPATGRFLSRGAWSNADKPVFHPYVYARNNPASVVDPSGHTCEDPDNPNDAAQCPVLVGPNNAPIGPEDYQGPTPAAVQAAATDAAAAGESGVARPGILPEPELDLTGPGDWVQVNESMSARAALYQWQATGAPPGYAYMVNGVKFDGYANGTLLEAKEPGYANFVDADGNFYDWFNGRTALVDQAQRQLAAAGGTPITWHVAEAQAATAIQNLFTENNITGITVVYDPPIGVMP